MKKIEVKIFKKAFTLIELIAVILILGIIALIAIPTIGNIIEETKLGAAKQSANNYIKTLEQKIELASLKHQDIILDGNYDIQELDIKVKGEAPSSGNIKIQNGEVKECTLIYNAAIVTCDSNGISVFKNEGIVLVADNDLDGDADVGDKICVGAECFYVISNTSGTVKALAEHNLNVGYNITKDGEDKFSLERGSWTHDTVSGIYKNSGTVATPLNFSTLKQDANYKGFIDYDFDIISEKGVINFGTDNDLPIKGYWAPSGTLLSTYGSSYSSYPYVYDSNSTLYSYVESYATSLTSKAAATVIANLITFQELESLGCDIISGSCIAEYYCTQDKVDSYYGWSDPDGDWVDCETAGQVITSGGSAPSWVYSSSYWTGSAADDSALVAVMTDGTFNPNIFNGLNRFGIRPVITVSASNIK